MKRFREYYTEGRDSWSNFQLAKTNKRWSFKNIESGQRYFIKLDDNNPNFVGGLQKFLEDIGCTNDNIPKSSGQINYNNLALDIISGKKTNIHVKSSNFEKIKEAWIID